jgi:NAD(P)-dependent dehydrogenase (short-subunit alcohol dehydrogenase family)
MRPPSTVNLTERVAVVTGAGHGLGKSHAAELARDGAKVAVFEIEGPAGAATAEAIKEDGG